MAIHKDIVTPHGVTASYHRLTNVSISASKDLVEMSFAIFATQEARDAGKMPLWNEHVLFKLSELQPNPLELLYELALYDGYLKDGTPDKIVPNAVQLVREVVLQEVDTQSAERDAALAVKPTAGAR